MAVSMSMNRVIHAAVRRDLSRFAQALSAFPAGDPQRAAQRAADLGVAWRYFRDELTRHHVDEHAIAWPTLLAIGVSPELLAEFDSEHDAMAAALAAADEAMAALQSSPTAASAAAAGTAIATLHTVTVKHLDREEAELEPVYAAKKDTAEVKEMGRKFSKVSPQVAGNFFAWIQNGASADEQAAVRASLPRPVLAILGGVFGRPYRRTVAPVWRAGA